MAMMISTCFAWCNVFTKSTCIISAINFDLSMVTKSKVKIRF